MIPHLRQIVITFSILAAAFLTTGCGLLAQKADEAEVEAEPQPLPSRHEVYLPAKAIHSLHSLSVLYPPPSPLSEQPPEAKPIGDDVVWVPGYWMWETRRDNWVWVSGVWVHAPAAYHWVAGYWSIEGDGWRWIPGSWVKDEPPPPSYTPPPPLAFGPRTSCYDDPSFGPYGAYGMWFPWYGFGYGYGYGDRRLEDRPPGIERPPLLPSGHAAAIPVEVHGPPTAEALPPLFPALASSIHEPPTAAQHLDMASILASVPKPMTAEFAQHPELHPPGVPSLTLGHEGKIAALFSTEHLQAALHEHAGVHEALTSHPGGSGGHGGGGSHGSGGHGGGGGGHGR